ncbi:MAG: M28 family metallopeptidase [Lysobacter sp.]|nr:M28 family metallopeptidase [Lysobacter sp.]
MTRSLIALAAVLALSASACKRDQPASAQAPSPPTPAAAAASTYAFDPAIRSEDFAEMVKTLSSDAFEGRAPGSIGEEKTVEYIKAQFERIGLQPGNSGSFFQTVPMTETAADEATTLKIAAATPYELKFGSDMVIGTRTGKTNVKIDGSEMVFVGYGVNAPELKWNDYAGVDVKGKTVVMLVNDPGFHANDDKLFEGKRMTYYGRWTYKFEEAARQGAAAALIIHDDAGASYGWDVVKNSWSGAQFDLRAADDPAPRLPAQGWITADAAKKMFGDAGLDLAAQYKAANTSGFKAMPLKAKLSVDLNSSIDEKQSRNVIGVLPGVARADEAVVYMAHWDHLGKHDDEPGDNIYNGAVDNATGVAGIIEIAGAFAAQNPKPDRSVVFLAVTLEESGLLGSKYYVAHPTVPLNRIAGVINIDAMSVSGKTRDITVVGFGSSQLEDILKPIAGQQQRALHAETNTAAGYYFRSDHFNFAKAGVPALYVDGGDDFVDGGKAAGEAAAKDYTENRYHKPADQYDAAVWKLDGVLDDLNAVYGVGRELTSSNAWPNWYEGNAFRAARDASMKVPPAK